MKTEGCKFKVCNIAECNGKGVVTVTGLVSVKIRQQRTPVPCIIILLCRVLLQLFQLSHSLEGCGNLGNQKQQIPSSEFCSLQVEGRKLGSFTKEGEDSQQSFSFLAVKS